MIDSNELMRGNLVTSKTGKDIYKVISIYEDNVDLFNEKTNRFNSHGCDLYGVKLTEEILLDCGFIDDGYLGNKKYYYSIEDFQLNVYYHEFVFNNPNETIKNRLVIKNLHQLQNLYFALTGQELNTDKI